MASLKPVVRLSQIKIDKKCNIKIRVCHERKVAYIKTPYNIEPRYMNDDGHINSKYPGQAKLNIALNLLLNEYNGILESIGNDIIYMDLNSLMLRLKRQKESGKGIIAYIEQRMASLQQERRYGTATMYYYTAEKLKLYSGKDEIPFKEVNLDFLQGFETEMRKDKSVNSVRSYLNIIRASFNHAIDNDVIRQELFPFRKFRIKSEKTRKRNLKAEELKILLQLKLSPLMQKAMDLFMLSFYLLGMNFKDMLYLTPESVSEGRIYYNRAKTKKGYSVKITPEAQQIIDKYRGKKYLLKFLDEKDGPKAEINITSSTNAQLKEIMKLTDMDIPISTYYARHSWATIAYSLGVSKDVISEALGHSTGSIMTEIYIERDTKKIDKAQRMVINAIKP